MARGVRIKLGWFGPEFMRNLHRELGKRLRRVGAFMERRVKENISDPTRGVGPSLPGEFPHADTGFLRQSIFHDVQLDRMSVIVGTPVIYGLYLEVGTSNMAARSFLRRTLFEEERGIRKKFLEPITRNLGPRRRSQ